MILHSLFKMWIHWWWNFFIHQSIFTWWDALKRAFTYSQPFHVENFHKHLKSKQIFNETSLWKLNVLLCHFLYEISFVAGVAFNFLCCAFSTSVGRIIHFSFTLPEMDLCGKIVNLNLIHFTVKFFISWINLKRPKMINENWIKVKQKKFMFTHFNDCKQFSSDQLFMTLLSEMTFVGFIKIT
jgi:recombinational DNA repair protein (RecF pathway)